jgi:hypothetical protein
MASPAQAFPLSKVALEGLLKLSQSAYMTLNKDWQIRNQLIDIDCAYMREGNLGQENFDARTANRYGDKSRIQDIVVPIVMPQVEAGVTHLSKVFLSGNPIFGVVTNKAAQDEIAAQYDAIMEENGIRGGWVRQLNMFFRDGLKYNLHGLEVNWETKNIYSVETDMKFSASEGKPTEAIWQGNTIKRLDMYNTIFDTRVAPAEVHSKGEFAGYIELYSRVALKQYIQDLKGVIKDNIKPALESGKGGMYANSFFIPQINPQAILANNDPKTNFDWGAWATETAKGRIAYSNAYEIMTLYVRIIPSDFNMTVPGRNQPQIWKLIIVNQEVIIFAERQTNAHNYLNILIGQPLEDGLNYQTKSFAQNTQPLQDAASAMLNASLNAKRRMQFDRLLYNPSLVRKEDINSSNPIARIPVRPAAYMKNLGEAVYSFPFNDAASQGMLQEMGLLVQFADKTQGINAATQGQFTKGNRTKHEYDDITGNSDGRLQTIAMFIEAQVFVPLKEMLKLNIMQYAPAGEIYSRETKRLITIDPLKLREAAIEFKVSDGFLPSDKLISAEVMQTALQVAGASPAIQAQLDIVGLFLHYLKTQGARDIEQFRIAPVGTQPTVDTTGNPTQQTTPVTQPANKGN